MDNFESHETPATPSLSPEVAECQKIIEEMHESESGASAETREKLSGKLQEAAKKLAERNTIFREILVETFKQFLEADPSAQSNKHWVDKVFMSAFAKFQEGH